MAKTVFLIAIFFDCQKVFFDVLPPQMGVAALLILYMSWQNHLQLLGV